MKSDKVTGPPNFNPKDASSVSLFSDVGRRADRPFMMLATFAETSLGDLISKVAFVTSLKDQFDYARLVVRYNDFRPYSREIISLSPNIDHAEAIRGESPQWMRKFSRDLRLWRPLSGAITRSKRYHEAFYDLVVIDSMANSRTVHVFDPATPLRVPTHLHEGLTQQLIELGVNPDKCFAVVHYRDGSYSLKSSNPVRNGEPESYRQAIDHIIDKLGCQVVQIGHREMKPFPARPGLIDLSQIEDPFMVQAFAVSRARFMIGGASGPTSLGWSFNIPTAVVDCPEAHSTWGSPANIFLTHEVTTPDGKVLRNQALHDAGLLDIRRLSQAIREGGDHQIRKNSAEEIAAVADHLHLQTADIPTWRGPPVPPSTPRPNTFTWPPQVKWNVKFLDV